MYNWYVEPSNIKHQSRPKVLHKLFYSQHDILATLVKAVVSVKYIVALLTDLDV